MSTFHKIINANSQNLSEIKTNSVDLVVTSPPYPMIQMWDEQFISMNKDIGIELEADNGRKAFGLMNKELEKVYKELIRVTKKNRFIVINMGDATRTIGGDFQLYSTHSKIIEYFTSKGLHLLPTIFWKKPTNTPNKFMGSGTLPAGAYVTLENEHILIFRNGSKRNFDSPEEKLNRQKSSYFWEERNVWFSDTWRILGAKQATANKEIRKRSAAYPIEIAYRLIQMFSVKGDTVLDPFGGLGTTSVSALSSERNSIVVEIEKSFIPTITSTIMDSKNIMNNFIEKRLSNHVDFISNWKNTPKHTNAMHGFGVVTSPESKIELNLIKNIETVKSSNKKSTEIKVDYVN